MKNLICKIACLALITVSTVVSAQTVRTISGTVRDALGQPIAGAVVLLEGVSGVGTNTDLDGRYVLPLPISNGVVKVQCLGFTDEKVELGKVAVYDFVLKEDSQMLEKVVVVGYGTMRESDITGSVSQIKIDENEAARSTSINQMMQGRVAGVQVQTSSAAPGAGINIRIRGNSSFNGGGEPLYVIDGIIINSSNESTDVMSKAGDESEETSGLLGIDPQDIASMEILKDASATAIYGAQGANGVILITTKMAQKEKPVINFSAGVDISTCAKKIDIFNLDQYIDYMFAKNYTAGLKKVLTNPDDRNSERKVDPMDWQDYMMRNAISQRYYFSVSNKNKSTSYSFSANYKDIQGIMKNTGLKQIGVRLNLNQKITKKLNVGMKLNLSKIDSHALQGLGSDMTSTSSAIRAMLSARPYYTPDDSDDDATGLTADIGARPDRWLKDYQNNSVQYRVMPSLNVEWKIIPWLTYKLTFGADYKIKNTIKWKGPFISMGAAGALAGNGEYKALKYNIDNLLMFDKKFGKIHNLSGTIGVTFHNASTVNEVQQGWKIDQYMAQENNINSAPIDCTTYSYSESSASTLSFLARLIYSLKGRYIFTGTFRRDGSSRFSKLNRYANFPSFAFAWRVNEEPWFGTDKISTLKLRAGWGRVGNQALASYQTLSNFSGVWFPDHSYGNDKNGIRGIVPANLANTDLKWETTEQENVGIDFKLNRNRFSFTLDVYNKDTKDLLQKVNIPESSGFSTMWMNIGSINNRGVEFSANAILLKKHDFSWDVFGNISHNRNTITSIGIPSESGETPYFYGSQIGTGSYCITPVTIFIEGQPMGLLYGIKTEGILQEGEVGPGIVAGEPYGPGQVKYVDLDGNNTIDNADRQVIGNSNPDFTYGFGTSFSWRDISLDVLFEGSYGNDIANLNLLQEYDITRNTGNMRTAAFLNAWTPENKSNEYPSLTGYSSVENRFFTSRHVEDGSYLRLASVTLSYYLRLKRKLHFIEGINFSVSGNNLAVFTKYKGWDPDVNSFGSNIMKMGCDYGSYPKSRTFSFDIKLKF